MRNAAVLAAATIWLASASLSGTPQDTVGRALSGAPGGPDRVRPTDIQQTVSTYCVTCHNDKLKTGGLVLDRPELADVAAHADVWEKVIRKVRTGMMPPAGNPRPSAAERSTLLSSLVTTLDAAARATPNPGRPLAHRMNRAEYANAIRDLLALDVDAAALLPPDDSSAGFDNNADVLGVSPVLLESYLTAAERVTALALGDRDIPPAGEIYRVKQDESQDRHIPGLPLGTVGGILINRTLPLDGDYQFRVTLFRTNLGTMRGLEYEHQLEISVDGQRVHLAAFGGDAEIKASSDNPTTTGDSVDGRFTVRVPLKAGPHRIGVAFLEKTHAFNTRRLQNYVRSSSDTIDFSGYPHIDEVILTGPFNATGAGQTPSRRRIFTCTPKMQAEETAPASATSGRPATRQAALSGRSASQTVPARSRRSSVPIDPSEVGCARQILATVARRAYRADVSENDIATLMTFFQQGRKDGGSFQSGIDLALRRVLTSPKFIFRTESDPPSRSALRRDPAAATAAGSVGVAGQAYRISDTELASRLSFFVWSSIPDDELLDTAARGTLRASGIPGSGIRDAGSERQVRRMLADPKSQALIDNFAGQWLQLRNLKNKQPNSHEFPDFDDNLRQALLTETELFFSSIVREDRSVLDLMNADYTFLNERLARHYGIPNVYGSHFRRVVLPDETRRGLLGKGAVLMVTSHPHRTSPVIRGKWVLENILGAPPPPPPDVVPPFQEETEAARPRSVRERLEVHRRNPACAGCHRMIDPAGLALENFDAVGAWRTRDGGTRGTPVDASGQLVDGTKVDGVVALRAALMREPDIFVSTVTEKLLTYALGRGLTAADMPAVRTIVRDAQRDGYRFSSIVLGIVRSVPFQMRTASSVAGSAPRARLRRETRPTAVNSTRTRSTVGRVPRRAESVGADPASGLS